jgi:hypothetical protein
VIGAVIAIFLISAGDGDACVDRYDGHAVPCSNKYAVKEPSSSEKARESDARGPVTSAPTNQLQTVEGPVTPTTIAVCLKSANFDVKGIEPLHVAHLVAVEGYAPDGSIFLIVRFPNSAQANQLGKGIAGSQGLEVHLSADGRTLIATKDPSDAALAAADRCTRSAS